MVLRADRAEFTRQCEELAGSTPADVKARPKAYGKKQMQDNETVV